MASRILLGIGAGSVSVTRTRAPAVASSSIRSGMIAWVQLSFTIGATVGPLLQHAESDAGVSLGFLPIQWSSFTAGPIMMVLLNLLLLAVVFFKLDDRTPENEEPAERDAGGNQRSNVMLFGCGFTTFSLMLFSAAVESIFSMYMELLFNWSPSETSSYSGYVYAVHGAVEIFAYTGFSFLFRKMSTTRARILYIIVGVSLGLFFFLMTFPFPFGAAFDCRNYGWCSTTPKPNAWLFSAAFYVVMAVHFPVTHIPMGNVLFLASAGVNQGKIMGGVMLVGSLARVGGPPLISFVFEQLGPMFLWILLGSFSVLALVIWVLLFLKVASGEDILMEEVESKSSVELEEVELEAESGIYRF